MTSYYILPFMNRIYTTPLFRWILGLLLFTIAWTAGYIFGSQNTDTKPTSVPQEIKSTERPNPLGKLIVWNDDTVNEFSCSGRIAPDFWVFVKQIGFEELANSQHFSNDGSGIPWAGMEVVEYNSWTEQAFTGIAPTPSFYRKLLILSGRLEEANTSDDHVREIINIIDSWFSRACISDRYYLLKASRTFMMEWPIALYIYDRGNKTTQRIDESLDLTKLNESYHPSRIYYRDGLINMESVIAYMNENGSIDFGYSDIIYGLKYQFDLSDWKLKWTPIAPERLRRE